MNNTAVTLWAIFLAVAIGVPLGTYLAYLIDDLGREE